MDESFSSSDLRRAKAKKRAVALAAITLVAVGGVWYFFSRPAAVQSIAALENSVAQKVQSNFSAPPPLTAATASGSKAGSSGRLSAASNLTVAGIIAQTNLQRKANGGLPALSENGTLDGIAAIRLTDLFAQQYFEHVGPQGESALTVASSAGYAYISLGENLALGMFEGDKGVVDAWMGSPGHRANILNAHYTQIGAAAREGVFQGNVTWIAVQVFGRPASDCPMPDAALDAQLNSEEAQLSTMDAELKQENGDIDAMNPKQGQAYEQAVSHYNAGVAQYNALAAQAKADVAQYNAEVDTYNMCLTE